MNGLNEDENDLAPGTAQSKIETPDERTVNYIFPITIVVVGALTNDDHDAIDKRIWVTFNDAIRNVV
jgi:hypothetical protein